MSRDCRIVFRCKISFLWHYSLDCTDRISLCGARRDTELLKIDVKFSRKSLNNSSTVSCLHHLIYIKVGKNMQSKGVIQQVRGPNFTQFLLFYLTDFLTQVPEAVHHSLSLQHLDLSSNLLGVLKRESLQGLPKLTTLKLGNNELSRLGEGTFVEVDGLQDLDLSRNRFLSMETDTLKELKDLRSLDLSQNQLEDVNGLFTMHQTALQ